MTLECINPKDLPTPEIYTQVVVATEAGWYSSRASSPKTSTASSLAMVISGLRRAWRLAISAARCCCRCPA